MNEQHVLRRGGAGMFFWGMHDDVLTMLCGLGGLMLDGPACFQKFDHSCPLVAL